MLNNDWAVKTPIETFFFDCDGTMSLIEGIDELAMMNGVGEEVKAITTRCMAKTGLSIEDYRKRLEYVLPTHSQINALASQYAANASVGLKETIHLLHSLNKKVYILSAGIKASVSQFAETLGISSDKVLAVELYFDDQGYYKGFDETSNLVKPHGKALEIASILKPNETALLIGDGMSDWEARDEVTRFVGFAGLQAKHWLQDHCEFYITNISLFSLIPLSLTTEEVKALSPIDFSYYEKGLKEIEQAQVLLRGTRHV